LTVARTRIQQGRWYAAFEEIGDRSAAESLRGAELSLEVDAQDEAEEDPDAWYPSQLKGLTVLHVDGHELGVVAGIDHYPVQDLLIVRTPDRRSVQLPLVEQLVPEVDLEAGVVRADPPGGLFEGLPEEAPADDPEQDWPMRIDVITIFPDYLPPLELSLIGRARREGLLELVVHDLRVWTHDRHRTVDDSPLGGGAGMVMKPEP